MITTDTSLEWSVLFIAMEILLPSKMTSLMCLHLKDVFRADLLKSQILDLPPRPCRTGTGCCSEYQMMHRCPIRAALAAQWLWGGDGSRGLEGCCVWRHDKGVPSRWKWKAVWKITEFSPWDTRHHYFSCEKWYNNIKTTEVHYKLV